MADKDALFEELKSLSQDEAKTLSDMLLDKMPKSEPKADKDQDQSGEASEESAS